MAEPIHHTFVDFLKDWWPIIVAFGAFTVTIVVNVKYRIPELTRRLGILEEKVVADETQALGFVVEEDCIKHQRDCRSRVCVKIDDLKELNAKVEGDIGKLSKQTNETNVRLAVMTEQIKNLTDRPINQTAEVLAKEIVKLLKGGS